MKHIIQDLPVKALFQKDIKKATKVGADFFASAQRIESKDTPNISLWLLKSRICMEIMSDRLISQECFLDPTHQTALIQFLVDSFLIYFQTLEKLGIKPVSVLFDELHSGRIPEEYARSIALAIHVKLLDASNPTTSEIKTASAKTLASRVSNEEALYRKYLFSAFRYMKTGATHKIAALITDTIVHTQGPFSNILLEAILLSRSNPRYKFLGLRMSSLGRRFVATIAGLILCDWALRFPTKKKPLSRIVGRIKKVTRKDLSTVGVLSSLAAVKPGAIVKIAGRVTKVDWIERPVKPISIVTLDNGITLMAPYKSLPRLGVAVGSMILVVGIVKKNPKGNNYVEIKFDGIKKYSKTYKEDFLASAGSGVYNLSPSSLSLDYEYQNIMLTDGAEKSLHEIFARVARPLPKKSVRKLSKKFLKTGKKLSTKIPKKLVKSNQKLFALMTKLRAEKKKS